MTHYHRINDTNQYYGWHNLNQNQLNWQSPTPNLGTSISTNEQKELMDSIQALTTQAIDNVLILDVFPHDEQRIKAVNDIHIQLRSLTNEYESKYGPLSLTSNFLTNIPWQWLKSPWPWEE